jgi:hypothetical protein
VGYSLCAHSKIDSVLQRLKKGIAMQGLGRGLSILLPLMLAGCVTAPDRDTPLPNATAVPIGKAAYVDGPVVRVKSVLEDSRCPINARCIQAGDVRLAIEWLRPGKTPEPFEIRLSRPLSLADGIITLEDVQPGRIAGGKELKPQDYRFQFSFQGGL